MSTRSDSLARAAHHGHTAQQRTEECSTPKAWATSAFDLPHQTVCWFLRLKKNTEQALIRTRRRRRFDPTARAVGILFEVIKVLQAA